MSGDIFTRTRARCSTCEYEVVTENWSGGGPNYCPDCGTEWTEKKLGDVEFPIDLTIQYHLNVVDRLVDATGVSEHDEFWEFPSDKELLFKIRVHRDGTIEKRGDCYPD
jgi:RNA polymerase subunit RPABC4/transcription elongation factor Spt4